VIDKQMETVYLQPGGAILAQINKNLLKMLQLLSETGAKESTIVIGLSISKGS